MDLIVTTGKKSSYSGVPTEAQYPYLAGSTVHGKPSVAGTCSASTLKMPTGTVVNSYSSLTANAIQALIVNSPVVVYFWAENNFYSYSSGVFACSRAATESDLNHGV
jgi:hypothetical protein